MNESIKFNNLVKYYSFDAHGRLISDGELHNVTAAPLKDEIARNLTSGGTGTITGLTGLHWRMDGLTDLGTFQTYVVTTCYSTRYNNATRVSAINFSATYTATANVSVKTAALGINAGFATTVAVGDNCHFYSTNFNMACGSAGKLVIDWSVNF